MPFHLNAVVYQSDPFRLLQIIRNLVSNAVKFTETGAVVVSVSVLSDTESSSRLRFDVQDTGRGIPPDQVGVMCVFPWRYVSVRVRMRLFELLGMRVATDVCSVQRLRR